jgi:hypothetical protein
MNISASARSYQLQDDYGFQGCNYYYFRQKVLYDYCTNVYCCILYSFDEIYVVNFNVSSTKLMHMLDFLDTSSMGVTVVVSLYQ